MFCLSGSFGGWGHLGWGPPAHQRVTGALPSVAPFQRPDSDSTQPDQVLLLRASGREATLTVLRLPLQVYHFMAMSSCHTPSVQGGWVIVVTV